MNRYETGYKFKKSAIKYGNLGHPLLLLEKIRRKLINKQKHLLSNEHLVLVEL